MLKSYKKITGKKIVIYNLMSKVDKKKNELPILIIIIDSE